MDSRVRPHLQSLGQHVLELTSVRELGNLGAFPADCPSQLCVCGFLPIGIILVQYGIPYAMRRGAKTSAHAIFASTSMIQKILFFCKEGLPSIPGITLPTLWLPVWSPQFGSVSLLRRNPLSTCHAASVNTSAFCSFFFQAALSLFHVFFVEFTPHKCRPPKCTPTIGPADGRTRRTPHLGGLWSWLEGKAMMKAWKIMEGWIFISDSVKTQYSWVHGIWMKLLL